MANPCDFGMCDETRCTEKDCTAIDIVSAVVEYSNIQQCILETHLSTLSKKDKEKMLKYWKEKLEDVKHRIANV